MDFNFLITAIYIAFAFLIVWVMFFTYAHHSKFQTVTGTVTYFKEHKENWLDVLAGAFGSGSDGSYLKIRFADDTYFEAKTKIYKYIDAELFSNLVVGDEITIVFAGEGQGGKNNIYGIEYKGNIYLNAEEVLSNLNKKQKIAYIVCPILLTIVSVTACGLYVLNFKKNRHKVVKEPKNDFMNCEE
ncbi:MAG: hypothetical protein K2N84_06755 [Clostridia bacterium]|nr:hypothetical protein [Clostridia bacterium]